MTEEELRKQVQHILGYCGYTPKGSECPHELADDESCVEANTELDQIMALIRQDREAAEQGGASIAATEINRELGLELTTNGAYYLVRHERLTHKQKEKEYVYTMV